ncbi:hypothetical protein G9A89_009086 [Geosiphon pyriformis]|nr:hypothetical protein G9A89_009086 [Geosiphon pyriformis]
MPIKVLIIKATQYQALVSNNWLSKTNAVLNWNTQELQLSQNGQHMQVPAIYEYFKTTTNKKPKQPTWEAYQVLWADNNYNKLPPILTWEEKGKRKKRKKESITVTTSTYTLHSTTH